MDTISPSSVDLIVCLQAFHWLDAPLSLSKFTQVLSEKGKVCIAWNDRDLSDDFIREWEGLVERRNTKYTRYIKLAENYEHLLTHSSLHSFTKNTYPNPQTMTADTFVELMKTFSYVRNALSSSSLDELEVETRELVKRHYGEGTFELHWTTKVYTSSRI